MKKLFDYFHELVKARIERYSHQCFGEDSIRYDFYFAMLKLSDGLTPTDLILEEPMPASQFKAKIRDENALKKQGRQTEKPEFDFRVGPCDIATKGLIGEFAYFRRPEKASNQDKSAKHGKLFNEIFRLALLKHYSLYADYTCLLLCVTDDEMIEYGYGSRGKEAIPVNKDYYLDDSYLSRFSDTTRNAVKPLFLDKAQEIGIVPTAKRIFTKEEPSIGGRPKWATWIWDVSFERQ